MSSLIIHRHPCHRYRRQRLSRYYVFMSRRRHHHVAFLAIILSPPSSSTLRHRLCHCCVPVEPIVAFFRYCSLPVRFSIQHNQQIGMVPKIINYSMGGRTRILHKNLTASFSVARWRNSKHCVICVYHCCVACVYHYAACRLSLKTIDVWA